jgi:hypothetical protein
VPAEEPEKVAGGHAGRACCEIADASPYGLRLRNSRGLNQIDGEKISSGKRIKKIERNLLK